MPLSPEQIKALLNKPPEKPKRAGRKAKNAIDYDDRTVVTWFKLGHKLIDSETGEPTECSNPNCQDTRPPEKKMVAEVNGLLMCRRCFLSGYGSEIEGQVNLDEHSE